MVIFPLLKDLRIIRVQMGNENGDGMDGGTFGNQNWGGGRFSFKLCFQDESRCCETGKLKTEDNYRGSPDSTNFGPPGDRTIAKIVLSGD